MALIGLLILAFGCAVFARLVLYTPELTRSELKEYISEDSRFVLLPNRAEVHYRDEGVADGPAILLLHGGLGSLHNWEGWVSRLGSTYRLVSIDLPGHGLTGQIPSDIYMRSSMAETALQLADHLGIGGMVLAGHSMGGGVALRLALDHPGRVLALILVGSEGIPNAPEGYDASAFSSQVPVERDDPRFTRVLWYERIASRFLPRWVLRRTLSNMLGEGTEMTPALERRLTRILQHEGNRDATALMFRQLTEVLECPRDVEPRLHEISAPTLYLHGEQDVLVPTEIAQRFEKLIPDAELKSYEGVGHFAMIEEPAQTAADVREFLSSKGIG